MDDLRWQPNPAIPRTDWPDAMGRLNLSDNFNLNRSTSSGNTQWPAHESMTSTDSSSASEMLSLLPPFSSEALWTLEGLPKEVPDRPTSRKGRSSSRSSLQNSGSRSKPNTSPPLNRSNALAKNRKAANKYRLRQKDYIENIRRRCQTEAEQRRIQSSLVRSLQDEISFLKDEVLKQSGCSCKYINNQLHIRDHLYSLAYSPNWHTAVPLSPAMSSAVETGTWTEAPMHALQTRFTM